jgi:nitroreductase
MELKQALLARRSVRSFTAEAVSDSDVDYLLHAGCLALPRSICVLGSFMW